MKPQSKRDGVVWISPPYGWVKENFDGSPKGNLGKAGYGVILRDHNANIRHELTNDLAFTEHSLSTKHNLFGEHPSAF